MDVWMDAAYTAGDCVLVKLTRGQSNGIAPFGWRGHLVFDKNFRLLRYVGAVFRDLTDYSDLTGMAGKRDPLK
jgi:hypothetical protein